MNNPNQVVADDPQLSPCRCVRCDCVLPPIHTSDHICEKCFQEWLDTLIDLGALTAFFEVLYGRK